MKKNLTKLILLSVALSFTACASNVKKVEEKSQERNISMKNLTPDEAFLEENKLKADVITTSSGLQYKVLVQGNAEKPNATDTVKVHYKGMLIDGTEFDSSYKRNEPISFPLNHVIKGWTEGLQLMGVGSKYILYIPSELAYGKKGAGNVIPPNSTLIFEVELLKIN